MAYVFDYNDLQFVLQPGDDQPGDDHPFTSICPCKHLQENVFVLAIIDKYSESKFCGQFEKLKFDPLPNLSKS